MLSFFGGTQAQVKFSHRGIKLDGALTVFGGRFAFEFAWDHRGIKWLSAITVIVTLPNLVTELDVLEDVKHGIMPDVPN